MALLPSALVITFGEMIRNRRQAWVLYGVMATMVVMFVPVAPLFEQAGTPFLAQNPIELQAIGEQPGGNMEGKETRFGIAGSSLFAVVTTSFPPAASMQCMTVSPHWARCPRSWA